MLPSLIDDTVLLFGEAVENEGDAKLGWSWVGAGGVDVEVEIMVRDLVVVVNLCVSDDGDDSSRELKLLFFCARLQR